MSGRSSPILNPENLTDQLSRAVATLGTSDATETARKAAAKTLHEALLLADSTASVVELLDTTAELAQHMKASNPRISGGIATASMGDHLLRTGDLARRSPKKPKSSPSSPDAAPNPEPAPTKPIPEVKTKRGFFWWLGRGGDEQT